MKKVLTVIMLAAVLIGCVNLTATAKTHDEQYVCELATSNAKVISAECVIYRRACVLAIKTEKFVTKSEYDEYVDGLVEKIKTDCEVDYVYVSRSPKLMNKLAELNKMDEDERAKAIEELIQKQLERRENGDRPLPPKFLTFRTNRSTGFERSR